MFVVMSSRMMTIEKDRQVDDESRVVAFPLLSDGKIGLKMVNIKVQTWAYHGLIFCLHRTGILFLTRCTTSFSQLQ